MAKQTLFGNAVFWIKGYANACANLHLMFAKPAGSPAQSVQNSVGNDPCGVLPIDAAQHYAKLVSTNTAERILIPNSLLEALGYLHQHGVPLVVPIGIVDRLESVQI